MFAAAVFDAATSCFLSSVLTVSFFPHPPLAERGVPGVMNGVEVVVTVVVMVVVTAVVVVVAVA